MLSVCVFFLNMYLFLERVHMHATEGRAEGEGKGENLKQTPCWMQSPTQDLISGPWDHDLSWNQELEDSLSHPGAPNRGFFQAFI